MKILSLNVNNFGGTNEKPLLKDYKLSNGDNDYELWAQAVDKWRSNNKKRIEKNVASITNLAKDFDIIFFHEVDTNCLSWNLLLGKMSSQYEWEPANGVNKCEYKKGRKSISCVFIKKGITFEYNDNNILKNQRNIEITVGNTHIIGLHMTYNTDDWDALILKYGLLKDEEFLIIGDLNVFDVGTDRRKKFDGLIDAGAIDIWLEQGESNDIPTANSNKRIDYALSTRKLYEKGVYEVILNFVRLENLTDHAAVVVTYNDAKENSCLNKKI